MEWIIILILLIAIFILFFKYSNLKGSIEDRSIELLEDWKQKELDQIKSQFEMQSKQAIQDTENIRIQLKKQTDKAIEDTEKIRIGLQKQTEQTKIQLEEQSRKGAQLLLEEWTQKEEERIRKDAINKSKSVIIGKVTEYLIPYFPGFKYNPKDVRFIGTPIDVIIFDGLDEGNVRQIIFGEIKTGKYGYLTSREKSVKNIIENKNVSHEIIRIETDNVEINLDNSQKVNNNDVIKIPHLETNGTEINADNSQRTIDSHNNSGVLKIPRLEANNILQYLPYIDQKIKDKGFVSYTIDSLRKTLNASPNIREETIIKNLNDILNEKNIKVERDKNLKDAILFKKY